MITESSTIQNHQMEDVSRGCLYAMAGQAGLLISFDKESHDYGIDGHFKGVQIVKNQRFGSGIALNFQLKASTNWSRKNGFIKYKLNADSYNVLGALNNDGPPSAILVVLCLPKMADWTCFKHYRGMIRYGCYYYVIKDFTSNASSKTIYIPETNLLTPDVVKLLLRKTQTGTL